MKKTITEIAGHQKRKSRKKCPAKTDIGVQLIPEKVSNVSGIHNQIELLSKQNEQLQMVLFASKAVINEKDHVIQSKDKIIQSKDELIAELRRKKIGFFSRLFGGNSIF